MDVILTRKPGRFRTGLTPGLAPAGTCDDLSHENRKARFVIAGTRRLGCPPRTRQPDALGSVPARLEPVAA